MQPEFQRVLETDIETFNYLLNWSRRHDFLFLEIPKTGCTTLKRMLQLIEVDYDAERLPDNVHDRAGSPLPVLKLDLAGFVNEVVAGRFFSFSFVRNPYTRALSAFLDKIVMNDWERNRLGPPLGFANEDSPTFTDFLRAVKALPDERRDIHWMSQYRLLCEHTLQLDFIGRFESFSEDIAFVINRLGADMSRVPLDFGKGHSTGARDKLAEHVTPEAARLVQEIYETDFQRLGYGWAPPVTHRVGRN